MQLPSGGFGCQGRGVPNCSLVASSLQDKSPPWSLRKQAAASADQAKGDLAGSQQGAARDPKNSTGTGGTARPCPGTGEKGRTRGRSWTALDPC